MAGMTIPDAMAMLWLRMVDENEDPEFVEALKVAVAELDYSMGSRIDCDTCGGTGLLFRDDDDGGKTAIECLVCEGFGHADPKIVKASWGEWPSATEVITKSEAGWSHYRQQLQYALSCIVEDLGEEKLQ